MQGQCSWRPACCCRVLQPAVGWHLPLHMCPCVHGTPAFFLFLNLAPPGVSGLQVKKFIADNQTDKPGAIPAQAAPAKPKR